MGTLFTVINHTVIGGIITGILIIAIVKVIYGTLKYYFGKERNTMDQDKILSNLS